MIVEIFKIKVKIILDNGPTRDILPQSNGMYNQWWRCKCIPRNRGHIKVRNQPKSKTFFLHLDRRKKCTESPVYSLEREKVRNLVQTFGVDIKQVLPYVFAPHKNQILSKKCQSLPFSEQKNRFFCTIEWLKGSKRSVQTIPSTRSSTPSSSTWESQSRLFSSFLFKFWFLFTQSFSPLFFFWFLSFIFFLNQPERVSPDFFLNSILLLSYFTFLLINEPSRLFSSFLVSNFSSLSIRLISYFIFLSILRCIWTSAYLALPRTE